MQVNNDKNQAKFSLSQKIINGITITSRERYWLKSTLPSKSSFHSSNAPRDWPRAGRAFFFSILWNDTSKIAPHISSSMTTSTFFFSFSPWPPWSASLTAILSTGTWAETFDLDKDSLVIICKLIFSSLKFKKVPNQYYGD